jgi:hypothetical protein
MKPRLAGCCAISMILGLAAGLVGAAHGHATYTGYSGAPGSAGHCASSCHGSGGGTVQASGFPSQYTAGQVYTITLSHVGGSAIRQFNASCRLGTGSTNAGAIAAGTSTVTYSTSGETNGVHLSANDLDTATFNWTAPAAGSGDARLYIGAHQGSSGGANTDLILLATEQVSDVPAGGVAGPMNGRLAVNFPNPFSAEATIGYLLPSAMPVKLEIYDIAGRVLDSFTGAMPAGMHEYRWDARKMPSGTYFYRVTAGAASETHKMILTR